MSTAYLGGLCLYTLEVEFKAIYELLASIYAYVDTKHHRFIELGPNWVRQVREGLSPGLTSRLKRYAEHDIDELLTLGQLLAWRSPAEGDIPSFLAWCPTLSSGDLYDMVAGSYMAGCAIPANLLELRDGLVDLLGGWNDEYFSRLDGAIISALESGAAALRERLAGAEPQSFVEDVSGGVVLLPSPEVSTVVLVPQYHVRPWSLVLPYKGTTFLLFPQETALAQPGEPHPRLVRSAKALGDPGRLRMLRFLGEQPRSFTEIVGELGLANSTINYHLGLLRAAGLVRVLTDATGKGPMQYALRQPALAQALTGISEYVGRDSEGE